MRDFFSGNGIARIIGISAAVVLAGCSTLNALPNSQLGRSTGLLSEADVKPTNIGRTIVAFAGGDANSWDKDKSLAENIAGLNLDSITDVRRNNIQDYLITVSNHNCGAFKRGTLLQQSGTNFTLGTLATLFAATGALVGPQASAQAFSGSAAALLGIKSQYNEDFFRERAFELITQGINSRRMRLLREIDERRSGEIDQYTVTRAIGDVVDYNNACSLIEGLEEAAQSVNNNVTLQQGAGVALVGQLLENSGANTRLILGTESPRVLEYTPPTGAITTSSPTGTAAGKVQVSGLNSSESVSFSLAENIGGVLQIDSSTGDLTIMTTPGQTMPATPAQIHTFRVVAIISPGERAITSTARIVVGP